MQQFRRTNIKFPTIGNTCSLAATLDNEYKMVRFSLTPLLILFLAVLHSCSGKYALKDIITPKEYLVSTPADKNLYTQDKLNILKKIEHFARTHQQSFYNQKYSDSTSIIVDSIFYNETADKLGVFVLEKFPPSREYSPKLYPTLFKSDWVYNAYCYLGRRERDSINLKWLRKFSFMGKRTLKEAKANLKRFYLVRFTTPEYPKPTIDEFNIDDKRFWTSDDWRRVFPN